MCSGYSKKANRAGAKKNKTEYPSVYYIEGISSINGAPEKIYYIVYRLNGKKKEEKAGRQIKDNMTAAKANKLRALRMTGKQLSNAEKRYKEAEIVLLKNIWTLDKLWSEFYFQKSEEGLKNLKDDEYRYDKHLTKELGHFEPKDLTVSDIDKRRSSLSKKLGPQTVKHILALL